MGKSKKKAPVRFGYQLSVNVLFILDGAEECLQFLLDDICADVDSVLCKQAAAVVPAVVTEEKKTGIHGIIPTFL